MAGAKCYALFIVAIVLTAQLCGCTAYVGGDGFSVEFIHRDSVESPFHDPTLASHGRLLAAVRRSTARASALARSYAGGSPNGAVSEVVSGPFEYMMYVNVGTPATRMLAVVDTGSNLVWFKCTNVRTAVAVGASLVFNPLSSSSFGRVFCQSGTCRALSGTSCDASSRCKYVHAYADGSTTTGLLSTENLIFDDAPGGCVGCRQRPQLLVPGFNFGCSTATAVTFRADGVVGLGGGEFSLITQIGAVTSLGRRFSYCLVPYSVNASSALNFGARAAVTEPSAATTALIRPDPRAPHYTVVLESVKIGNATFEHLSNVIVDSGTTLTFLDRALLDPIVEEMTRRVRLPRKQSPDKLLQPCYSVVGPSGRYYFRKLVPDVTLMLAVFAEAVTLKAENTFVEAQKGTMCLAMAPVTPLQPVAIIGNIAQHNFHVGYDLDKGTVTFAPADCASSYRSSSASV
ncbi:aspartic proteinase CDR1-like [Hordeum vulgare subsp. vulgare]|uniref:Peptidase A1 domain-containing protein n=1 Tax=Hordeum vulgare subsp. vulgare TaxID=112509 RepID=A0A8I7B9B2_HORVV|nr:aspartic proteinase CDR1-like [Hordeum vulgare subsp. vulgare]